MILDVDIKSNIDNCIVLIVIKILILIVIVMRSQCHTVPTRQLKRV